MRRALALLTAQHGFRLRLGHAIIKVLFREAVIYGGQNHPQLMGRHRHNPVLPMTAQGTEQHVTLPQPPALEEVRRLGTQTLDIP